MSSEAVNERERRGVGQENFRKISGGSLARTILALVIDSVKNL